MTAAFVLAINMFIAGIFAVAFGVVAATDPTTRGARWLAVGYATGIVSIPLEFLVPYQVNPAPVTIAIFLVFLLALTFCLVGIAKHYAAAVPWMAITAIWVASVLAVPLTFNLSYGSLPRGLLYQFPYFAMHVLVGLVILRARRRQPLDLLLFTLNGAAALLYLSKPLIAWIVGTAATPQGYMTTTYAALSQSIGSVTLVALALVLLLVMMRDTAAEMAARSETDALSGILNRRGFDLHAERMLARAERADEPLTLVTADIDHFKRINDKFGHAAGDATIAHVAKLLCEPVTGDALVSRLGGEEFAVLLAGATLADGRGYAERVRARLAADPPVHLGVDQIVTASFGVAQVTRGDTLFDLARRADAALYRAKAGGRNRVSLALGELSSAPCGSLQQFAAPNRPAPGFLSTDRESSLLLS
ncbi:GGDEF domain-containing protein [Pelagerythrobacter rhizovicinus]|uniref:diguanylate cyclase n=1 Tax=Pelagerythrobacter rhizovicinus TaxID=2268576 RepID=A0A4Q2KRU3_9SPHN|nr:GGDEF domain-containing protein [Pelagerythrobacter rhizovicinus]RXZ66402.1 GGDEF domain-containing protein [Pelagerythrobacter rhizovicinus]